MGGFGWEGSGRGRHLQGDGQRGHRPCTDLLSGKGRGWGTPLRGPVRHPRVGAQAMAVVFPILEVSNDSISSFADEAAFRRAVALSTDKAIDDGFFERVRVIDAALVEHRFARLELVGKSSFFGWMRRSREIESLELERVGEHDLLGVKALIADAITVSELGSQSGGAAEVLGAVEAAASFDELVAVFLLDLP
ncbi:MAG: hypothetical protein JNL38_31450 [Myxococcales bacterium]|nr:hypothetical protein [Myxococcales bacterium]